MNCYTSDPKEIYEALMNGETSDLELIGNAVTALAALVIKQQSTIKTLQEQVNRLQPDDCDRPNHFGGDQRGGLRG